jgi:pSer/pThr/pTyr-binding forkhead associated (FHA) protein
VVTVGRVPESADIVIPVATVSGVHARLEKKNEGSLVVTDMNSTNGTYINERKLVPGFPVAVNSGSLLIFGTANSLTSLTLGAELSHISWSAAL